MQSTAKTSTIASGLNEPQVIANHLKLGKIGWTQSVG